jgi:3-dehydroquinate synthase
VDSFYTAFFLDKKSSDSTVTFILADGIGGVKITDEVEATIVKELLHTCKAN